MELCCPSGGWYFIPFRYRPVSHAVRPLNFILTTVPASWISNEILSPFPDADIVVSATLPAASAACVCSVCPASAAADSPCLSPAAVPGFAAVFCAAAVPGLGFPAAFCAAAVAGFTAAFCAAAAFAPGCTPAVPASAVAVSPDAVIFSGSNTKLTGMRRSEKVIVFPAPDAPFPAGFPAASLTGGVPASVLSAGLIFIKLSAGSLSRRIPCIRACCLCGISMAS